MLHVQHFPICQLKRRLNNDSSDALTCRMGRCHVLMRWRATWVSATYCLIICRSRLCAVRTSTAFWWISTALWWSHYATGVIMPWESLCHMDFLQLLIVFHQVGIFIRNSLRFVPEIMVPHFHFSYQPSPIITISDETMFYRYISQGTLNWLPPVTVDVWLVEWKSPW